MKVGGDELIDNIANHRLSFLSKFLKEVKERPLPYLFGIPLLITMIVVGMVFYFH